MTAPNLTPLSRKVEEACSPRLKSLLAVIETLRYAQGDNFRFCQATLRKP